MILLFEKIEHVFGYFWHLLDILLIFLNPRYESSYPVYVHTSILLDVTCVGSSSFILEASYRVSESDCIQKEEDCGSVVQVSSLWLQIMRVLYRIHMVAGRMSGVTTSVSAAEVMQRGVPRIPSSMSVLPGLR